MGFFDRFRPRAKKVPVTIEQFAEVLSHAAFQLGFEGSECVAVQVTNFNPDIEDSVRFRIEVLAFSFLPLDIALVHHHPEDSVRVRNATFKTMAQRLRLEVGGHQQFVWATMPELLSNRLESYAEILEQSTPFACHAYCSISGESDGYDPVAVAFLGARFSVTLKPIADAVLRYSIIPHD